MLDRKKVVVVGAGIGGLTAAALLAKEGMDVTVLEAHVYPGGCAGTFYYQGYRFDAGATLAGGFNPGGPMDLLGRRLGIRWPVQLAEPAMIVHMPDGVSVRRYGDERRWVEYRNAFGEAGERFWRWQESAADTVWDLAQRNPLWPPQRPVELIRLLETGLAWASSNPKSHLNPGFIFDALTPLKRRLENQPGALQKFIDAQLLISAQTTSRHANALYAAAALDLPRRGVAYLDGGMGTIADQLQQSLARSGGRIYFHKEVIGVTLKNGRPVQVETRQGDQYPADLVIFNLTPWNIAGILGNHAAGRLKRLPSMPRDAWGAFTLYVGLPDALLPDDIQGHHQILEGESLTEGGSIFLSVSPRQDLNRAPLGYRALTISTHTKLAFWWQASEEDRKVYEDHKQQFTDKMLSLVDRVIPGAQEAAELILPGTPLTFHRFTRRHMGWVGGFPQTHLFRAWGPRIQPGIWMVGDSIFPGQSTAAVALGGIRVTGQILDEFDGDTTRSTLRWKEIQSPFAYQPIKFERTKRNQS